MSSLQIRVHNLQMSIFTPEMLFNKNGILAMMIEKFSEVFNGDVVSIPIPDDAPDEIPRIILNSKDATVKCEIAKSRFNIYCSPGDDLYIDSQIEGFLDFCYKIIEAYVKFTKAVIGRLAIVINKYIDQANPQSTLADHFCRDRWLGEAFANLSAFEIHALKKYNLDEFAVNSWVRCKSGTLEIKKKDIRLDIIHIIQDINTLAEELKIKRYTMEDVKKFISIVSSEHISILEKYFPEE